MMECDAERSPREIAADWHGGQFTALYSFVSTGTITHGLDREIEKCLRELEKDPGLYAQSPEEADTMRAELSAVLEYVTQPITSVWSSYGHTFDDGGWCQRCGAEYELVRDDPSDPSHGAYEASNGDEPMACTGDTSMVHGHGFACEGGCEHCSHDCNCVMCA